MAARAPLLSRVPVEPPRPVCETAWPIPNGSLCTAVQSVQRVGASQCCCANSFAAVTTRYRIGQLPVSLQIFTSSRGHVPCFWTFGHALSLDNCIHTIIYSPCSFSAAMLTGRAARSGRHLARLLSSNPTTAAASLGAPETSAQQQLQLQDCRWLSSRSADSASCTGSAASSPGGHSRLAALLGLQRQSWRGFADGASTSGGPPRQRSGGPAPPSGAGQQQYGSGQRSGGRGDSPWQTPGGGELTPHSEPSQQEGEVDELLAKWEALMDVEANPLEVLDTVWSSLEGEQVSALKICRPAASR